VAERLAREAEYCLYAPRVMPMDVYDVSKLPAEPLVVFVTSTTGQVGGAAARTGGDLAAAFTATQHTCCPLLQGDVPDNARRFWRQLMRKALQPGCLAGLRYALFGLGDSGYPEFNVSRRPPTRWGSRCSWPEPSPTVRAAVLRAGGGQEAGPAAAGAGRRAAAGARPGRRPGGCAWAAFGSISCRHDCLRELRP
jgi:hypothetical protein